MGVGLTHPQRVWFVVDVMRETALKSNPLRENGV